MYYYVICDQLILLSTNYAAFPSARLVISIVNQYLRLSIPHKMF